MKELVAFDFAVNDPDNGSFAGKTAMAFFGPTELEAPFGQEFKFTELPSAIRLHRHTFETLATKAWVGNRYWFSRAEGKRLLRLLRAKGWTVCCGPVPMVAWFDAKVPA